MLCLKQMMKRLAAVAAERGDQAVTKPSPVQVLVHGLLLFKPVQLPNTLTVVQKPGSMLACCSDWPRCSSHR